MPHYARALAAAAMLGISAPAMAACPIGNYEAVGWNPGQPVDGPAGYHAAVVITDRGADMCNIEWDLGGQHFSAVALFDSRANQLHGAYANLEQGWFGIISYRVTGARMEGDWAIYNSGTSNRGREILTRR